MSISRPSWPPARARLRGVIASVFAATLVLTACSSSTEDTESEAGGESASIAEDGAFPVTIGHALGETTIEQEPQRIAVVGWSTPDIVVALGRVPVAVGKNAYGADDSGFFPWFREGVDALGGDLPQALPSLERGEINFEALLETRPDLILATYSGISDEDYSRLTSIAPTVAYPETPWATPLDENIEIVGRALGTPARADELRTALNATIDTVAQEHPEFRDVTFVYGTAPADDGTVLLNGPEDNRVQLLEQLGFVLDAGVGKLAEASQNASSFNVSLEALSELAPQLYITNAEDESAWQQALASGVFAKWGPISNGNVVVTVDHAVTMSLSSPSPLSVPWGIERLAEPLSRTVAKLQ